MVEPGNDELVAESRAAMKEIAESAVSDGVPGIGLVADIMGTSVRVFEGVSNASSRAPLTSQSKFRVACVTHGLLAIALHSIKSPRRLDIDESILSILPEFESVDPHGSIQIRHLLSHSTGCNYASACRPGPQFEGDVREAGIRVFPPGAYLYYNADNTRLLEEVLTRHTGLSATVLIERYVLRRSVEVGSLSERGDQSVNDVSGHVRDTAASNFRPEGEAVRSNDLRMELPAITDVCRTFFSSGENDLGQLMLSPESLLPPAVGGTAFRRFPIAYSLGWGIYENGLFGLNGTDRGQSCAVRFEPTKRVSFAVGLTIADAELREQVVDLMERVLRLSVERPALQVDLNDNDVNACVGTYEQTIAGVRVSARVTKCADTISVSVTEGHRVLPTLTVVRRDQAGRWAPAENAGILPIRFFLSENAAAFGLMIGAASFWRTNDR